MAFSYEVKREVRKRVGEYKSELSGETERPMEFAHLYHGHGKMYEQACNCLLVTDIEHLALHMKFWDEPSLTGLSREYNFSAIRALVARCTNFSFARGTYDSFREDIERATAMWDEYFKEHELPTWTALHESCDYKKCRA